MHLSIFTDGGSRGNPGHSGYGFAVTDSQNQVIFKDSKYLGIKTNNEAEYQGLLGALTWLSSYSNHDLSLVDIYMDSELIVRQVKGIYKVKSANLIPIFTQIKALLSSFTFPVKIHHVLRHKNQLADQLANLAMDHGSSQKN